MNERTNERLNEFNQSRGFWSFSSSYNEHTPTDGLANLDTLFN